LKHIAIIYSALSTLVKINHILK